MKFKNKILINSNLNSKILICALRYKLSRLNIEYQDKNQNCYFFNNKKYLFLVFQIKNNI